MNENFLLTTKTAQRLYNDCAKKLPIVDYHNHLDVDDIAENRRFGDLAELWLITDPYKHRAMRVCGIEEKYITGDAEHYEKFKAWCRTVPELVGNPLYHWSHLELLRVFDIDFAINEENAPKIWKKANELLLQPEFSARGLLERFGVEYAAPCRMITDDVEVFSQMGNIAPSMRGDGILPISKAFAEKLSESANIKITSLSDLINAFTARIDKFNSAGCRFADYALDDGFCYEKDDGKNEERFKNVLTGGRLSNEEQVKLDSHIMRLLACEYGRHGWVMQLHIGALRYTSTRLRTLCGPAGGFAGIGNCDVTQVVAFLDDLEQQGLLPRTILFTLNPSANAQISILSGSFTQDGIRGKLQQGAAWWWCDHLGGIREVLNTVSEYGVLSVFLGMTTDSRSLLSFVRHEYFRRVLCSWIGEKAESGEYPMDIELLKNITEKICYGNVKNILETKKEN